MDGEEAKRYTVRIPSTLGQWAVKNGKVKEEKIDKAAVRIVRTLLAFTEANSKEYPKELIGCREHIELALEASEKSMTLMQNNNVLPFSKSIKKIAVIAA